MAQLRQDYVEFVNRNAEVITLGPDGPNAFKRYWEKESMPFIGLADVRSVISDQYAQEVNWLKLGRMPAVFVIDYKGMIEYVHYGSSMSDIPGNQEILKIIDGINAREQRSKESIFNP